MSDKITDQDIQDLKDALPVIRALTRVERFLQNAEALRGLERQVADLEARKAGLAGELSAQRAASVRDLEAALEQVRAAATSKATQLREAAEAKLADLEGKVKSLKLDEQRLQEGMAATRQRLTNELDGLKQQIREVSEASAKDLEENRTAVRFARATLAREKETLAVEKAALEQDIATLKSEKARIAGELRAVLGD
jgi:DNA repair exonuclease SbcCD ATPase subunit